MKYFITSIIVAVSLIMVGSVSAHVVVKPNQVGVAAYQTFTMGVPVEKDMPTVAMRLVAPEGIKSITPNVKPGWRIEIKKEGEGDNQKVTEVLWTGGSIPAGQRDEFLFSAQAPSTETTLQWKAYQTYQDGSVVAWDADPKSIQAKDSMEESAAGPYSVTAVVNDLKPSTTPSATTVETEATDRGPLFLSGIALVLSAVALGLVLRRKA